MHGLKFPAIDASRVVDFVNGQESALQLRQANGRSRTALRKKYADPDWVFVSHLAPLCSSRRTRTAFAVKASSAFLQKFSSEKQATQQPMSQTLHPPTSLV
jgi:hypothetical protein